MNPHLLFNALNTVAALIPSDPASAEALTLRLAELYRAVLDACQKERHSLAEELMLCRAYLEIEHARFGDRLKFEIDCDPSLDLAAISAPPLLVQPLIENAVKHGITPLVAGGSLRVSLARADGALRITVSDDGAGLGRAIASGGAAARRGTALANLRARLALAYGPAGSVSLLPRPSGGAEATLVLPLAPSQA